MRYLIALIFSLSTFIIFQSCQKTGIPSVSGTQLAEWNEAEHNAFTDLIKYDGYYYCVFRIASDHNSFDGKTRIIRSSDGKNWSAFALLSLPNMDLRDAHFFIDDYNVLSLSINIRNVYNQRQNVLYKLQNGQFIKTNVFHVDNDFFYWGFYKLNDRVYSVGYNVKQICFSSLDSKKPKLMLFNNANLACDSFQYANVGGTWINRDFDCPCEASMVITPDSTVIMIVRDEHTPGHSFFGVSKFPYKNWKWTTFPYFVRGPKLALLPNGKLLLAAGSMSHYDLTYYAIVNPDDFSVEKIRSFPSGGDTGYPGVVIEGNTALVSYYSSHEGNARVYIYRLDY
jgi:hypothetical protein